MTDPVWSYAGTLVRCVDGDTAVLELTSDPADIGFHVKVSGTTQQTCRLLDMNAREHDQPGGLEAKEHLRGLLSGPLRVVSVKLDNWGRSLCRVYLPDGTSVAELMVAAGFAAAWDGRRQPKPVPPWPLPTT